ncbi:MAG: hypothetical protein GY749_34880 [Desulfobacteraceae bacterium]|nr:hypothetical protein [Desulfobacteraceae bacterium]
MDNNGSNQNRIFAKLSGILGILLENKAIRLIGLIVAIASLIVAVAPNEVRVLIGLEKAQEKPSPAPKLDNPRFSYVPPIKYIVNENQPQFVKDAQTSLSVVFQNIGGEYFVTLNISPTGEISSARAVLIGYTEQFESSTGVYNIQVLSIDYDNKKIVVQVSRESKKKI